MDLLSKDIENDDRINGAFKEGLVRLSPELKPEPRQLLQQFNYLSWASSLCQHENESRRRICEDKRLNDNVRNIGTQ